MPPKGFRSVTIPDDSYTTLAEISDKMGKPDAMALRQAIDLLSLFMDGKLAPTDGITPDEERFLEYINMEGPRRPDGSAYYVGRPHKRNNK